MYNSNIPLHPFIEPNSPWIIPYDESRESSLYTLEQEEKEYNEKLRSIAAQPASVPIGFMMSGNGNANTSMSNLVTGNESFHRSSSGGVMSSTFHNGLSPIPRYDGSGSSAATSAAVDRATSTGTATRPTSYSSHHHSSSSSGHRRRRSGGRSSTTTASYNVTTNSRPHHEFPPPIQVSRHGHTRRHSSIGSTGSTGQHRYQHGGSDSSLDFTMGDDAGAGATSSSSSMNNYHHH